MRQSVISLMFVALVAACSAAVAWASVSTEAAAQAPAEDTYTVSVVVDAKDARGQDWDDGSRPDPTLFTDNPSGHRRWGHCENNLRCTYQSVYIPRGTILRLVDDDEWTAADLIGAGPVTTDSHGQTSVRLGGAQLTITAAVVAARAADAAATEAARPRQLQLPEVRPLLVGRAVSMTDGVTWSFAPTEPFTARIVSQTDNGPASSVVVSIDTNSSDGTHPATGEVRMTLRWQAGRPVFQAVESLSFAQSNSRPAPASGLSVQGTPNFGARDITPGFQTIATPDPVRVAIVSGGTLNVSSMNLGQGCTGFATAQPDFNFRLTGSSSFLRVYVDAVEGNKDTTLVINAADGRWLCNDDSNGGTNPMIDVSNAGPGLYNVWIGSYESGVQAHGRLNISEFAGDHP